MPILFQFARLIEMKGSESDYGGYQLYLHPPDEDIDSAILSYPQFEVNQGEIKKIKLSKVNLFSLSSDENPCYNDHTLFDETCAVDKVKKLYIGRYNLQVY